MNGKGGHPIAIRVLLQTVTSRDGSQDFVINLSLILWLIACD